MAKELTADEFFNATPKQSKELTAEQFFATPANQQEPEVAAGLIGKLGQGATFGLADEMQAGLFALPRYIGNEIRGQEDASLGGAYDQLLGEQRANLQAAQEQYPITSTGLEVAGAIGTGVAGAGTKLGKFVGGKIAQGIAPAAVSTAGKLGNLASRAAIGAGAAGTSGALYGAGSGEGEQGRLQSAKDFGMVGAAIGGALPIAGAGLGAVASGVGGNISKAKSGLKARDAEALAETLKGVKGSSADLYKAVDDIGAVLTPEAGAKLVTNIETQVAKKPFVAELNPKTLAVINSIKKAQENGNLKVGEIDQYRRLLSGIKGEDSVSAAAARQAIDDTLNGLQKADLAGGSTKAIQLLNKARAESAKGFKLDKVVQIVKKSDGDPNYVRRELRKILNDPRKLSGYTGAEIKALQDATKLNKTEMVAKVLGTFGFDTARLGSGVGAVFGSGVGGTVGGLTGAAVVPVLGTGARYTGKLISRGKVENLIKTIEQGGKVAPKDLKGLKPKEINEIMKAKKALRTEPTITATPRNAVKRLLKDEQGSVPPASKYNPITIEQIDRDILNNPDVTRWISKQKPKPINELYRGVSEASGNNMAAYGQGLYTTTDKNIAKQYGKVMNMGAEHLPDNPIQFDSKEAFTNFISEIADLKGARRNELGVEYRDLIKKLGYDGVIIGNGNNRLIVQY